MSITWSVVAIFFFLIEVATVNLVTLWFFFGAVVVMIAELLGLTSPFWQSVLFLSSSFSFFLVFYPWVKKKFRPKVDGANDHLMGQEAVVIEPVGLNKGAVELAGQAWSVKRVQGVTVPAVGDRVIIVALEGIKVVIEAVASQKNI
jgi:membrane protein implicated in regulation of membrane protease activity